MAKKKLERYCRSNMSDAEMDKFFDSGANVLVVGLHGTGKTSSMEACLKRKNVPYLKYCGSTMEPYLELVGVPVASKDTKGPFMEMVQRKEIRDCSVEAILFDEINRAPKAARNAVMEILQFGTVNGKKFGNIKRIWATANPHDEDDVNYDVEPLNPALEDRFQIRIQSPWALNASYFKKTHGEKAYAAVSQWWGQLPDLSQREVSPRRLDDALRLYKNGAGLALKFTIPPACNPSQLESFLTKGSPIESLEKLITAVKTTPNATTQKELKDFVGNLDNFTAIQDSLVNYLPDVFTVMPAELQQKYAVHMLTGGKSASIFTKFLNESVASNPAEFSPIIRELSKSSNDTVKSVATKLIAASDLNDLIKGKK